MYINGSFASVASLETQVCSSPQITDCAGPDMTNFTEVFQDYRPYLFDSESPLQSDGVLKREKEPTKNEKVCDTTENQNTGKIGSKIPHQRKLINDLPKRPPVDIEFENLSYSVQEPQSFFSFSRGSRGYKPILKSVSGKFMSGELTAIMGPSGAGKSTLMNIMAGYRSRNLIGDITINGKERSLRKFRKMSCYIMQDDAINPHLTVLEAMNVAASLKLEENLAQEEKDRIISVIISTLGLTECLNTRCSNISGGQRKRLAIAFELVNNPPVMLFDEPTSGLDSSSCNQCISLLKELAREGRTIVCTIHQPSSLIFEKFDKLHILADGQTIYNGTTTFLVPFLSNLGLECPSYHNPADFVMEVATGEHGPFTEKMVKSVLNGECDNSEAEGSVRTSLRSVATSVSALTNVTDITFTDVAGKEGEKLSPYHRSISGIFNNGYNRNRGDPDGESFHHSGGGGKEAGDYARDFFNGRDGFDGDEPIKYFKSESLESIDEHYNTFVTSSWKQFRVLLCRSFRSIIRDDSLTKVRLVSHVAMALLLGALFWDCGNDAAKVYNNAGMLFFGQFFCMFTAMIPTLMTFPMEMATFKREHLNYWYSLKSYYLAKVSADIPFQVLYPLVYVVIIYLMTSQPLERDRFLMFASMYVCTSLVSQSLGLVIGAAFDITVANFLGPVLILPVILFSGFFISFDNMPIYMYWISYISYFGYGFEGTLQSIYGFERVKLDCHQIYCRSKYPSRFLKEMAVDKAVVWMDAVALLSFFLGLRIIGYFVLKMKVKMDR